MLEENKPDKFEVDAGAQKLAIRTVIQALVDHASTTDPGLRDRISAIIDDYIAKLGPQSELEQDFADRARNYVAFFTQPPSE